MYPSTPELMAWFFTTLTNFKGFGKPITCGGLNKITTQVAHTFQLTGCSVRLYFPNSYSRFLEKWGILGQHLSENEQFSHLEKGPF